MFAIAPVEDSLDLRNVSVGVELHLLKILRHPAPIDQYAARLTALVQVRVHRTNHLHALLLVLNFANEKLLLNVKDAADFDWLHAPIVLELGRVLAGPGEVGPILRGDIFWC